MRDILKKMRDHVPESFFWLHVLLPAYMTISSLYDRPAVQAILFLSLWDMRQANFFLKIGTKKYTGRPFFSVTEQFR
jgi:hypothetical protein